MAHLHTSTHTHGTHEYKHQHSWYTFIYWLGIKSYWVESRNDYTIRPSILSKSLQLSTLTGMRLHNTCNRVSPACVYKHQMPSLIRWYIKMGAKLMEVALMLSHIHSSGFIQDQGYASWSDSAPSPDPELHWLASTTSPVGRRWWPKGLVNSLPWVCWQSEFSCLFPRASFWITMSKWVR